MNKKKTNLLKLVKILGCVLLALLTVFSITGCNGDTPTKESGTQTSEQSGTPGATDAATDADDTFLLNETAVFDNLKITATELKETNGSDYFEAADGKVFVGINFTIENISDETETISSVLLFDGYADGVKTSYSLGAQMAFGDSTLDGSLTAGKKMTGWYAVEVDENWKELELQVQSSWLSNSVAKFLFTK